MLDSTMMVASGHVLNPIVCHGLIGKNRRLRHHVIAHISKQRGTFYVGSNESNNAALTLSHAHDGSFLPIAAHWPSCAVFARSTVISFIHFHRFSLQLHVSFGQQRANLAKHPPSSFVGHSSFALYLLCGDSAARGCH